MMQRDVDGLEHGKDQWRLIEYGRYVHKPTLSRALHHIARLSSEGIAQQFILKGDVSLNGKVSTNPIERLHGGGYMLHLKEHGEYRFHIR
jgi:hypothetical protein